METKELALRTETPIPHTTLTLEGLQRLAKIMVASGYYKDVNDIAQGCVKILAGAEYGLSPIASMGGMYVVNGRVAMEAQLHAAVISRKGYKYRVREHSEKLCSIEFFEGEESLGVSTFTIEEANRAGLTGKDVWKKWPRNMLWARAMSNGCRWYCGGAFGGQVPYTPDEVDVETSAVRINGQARTSATDLTKSLLSTGTGHKPEDKPEGLPLSDTDTVQPFATDGTADPWAYVLTSGKHKGLSFNDVDLPEVYELLNNKAYQAGMSKSDVAALEALRKHMRKEELKAQVEGLQNGDSGEFNGGTSGLV